MATPKKKTAGTIWEEKERLLREISSQPYFIDFLNGIENTSVFFKNLEGEIIFGNEYFLSSVGFKGNLLDRRITDKDLFPSYLAEKYRRDDLEIIKTGKSKTNIIELFKNKQGLLQWFVTHKYPVFGRKKTLIGIIGSIHEYRKINPAVYRGNKELLATLEFIQQHFSENISIQDLSALSKMSIRQYERKFKLMFNTNPQEYIIRHRIHYACEALRNTKKDISDIGAEAGFYDQSSFTKQFKKYMDITPLKYRKELV